MHKQLGLVAVALALAACGKGGDDHWSKRPIETVSSSVDGQDFLIDVPKGMRLRSSGDGVELDIEEHDRVYTPDLRIGTSPTSSLDQYLQLQEPGATFTRKENVGKQFIVSGENDAYPGKQDFLIHSETPVAGGRSLTCDGRVTPYRPGDKVKDDLLPLVEKMCLSLRAK